ncbi:MAG: lytic transglycosylase domain-containing protein [Thermodesulfobacteriota bacterium]
MELKEPLIKTGHPPHLLRGRRKELLPSRIFRATLFVLIFLFSFHLPPIHFESRNRQEAIREILAVLERHSTGLADVTQEELAEVIYEEATRHNQDPKFILAVIAIESEFKTGAVSVKGAKGLMQIMPEVGQLLAQEIGIEWSGDRTLFNPFLNIRMGVYYLSQLTRHFKDPRIALTAYNYGPTYVQDLIQRNEGLPSGYYRRIFSVYHTL